MKHFINVPDYNASTDIVLLVQYNVTTPSHAKQIRRYLSIFGPVVVRGCNRDGSSWVYTDFGYLLCNQILGKYSTVLVLDLYCIALMLSKIPPYLCSTN